MLLVAMLAGQTMHAPTQENYKGSCRILENATVEFYKNSTSILQESYNNPCSFLISRYIRKKIAVK